MSRLSYLSSVISTSKRSNRLHFSKYNAFLFTPLQTLKPLCVINSTQISLHLTHTTPPKYRDNSLCVRVKLQADINTFYLQGEHLQF